MIKYILTVLFALILVFSANAQNKAYQIYTSKGVEIEYENMVVQLMDSDIIFFGELHNDPISHWLEYRLLKDASKMIDKKPFVGAEMFESDDQLILNEYLNGLIEEKHFKNETKIWNNYETGYRPLVEFAKKNNLKFIATNIPRRYASMVSREGFDILDTLAVEAKKYIAPLPIKYDPELPGYKNMLNMGHMSDMKNHVNNNMPKAQAVKDATMAYFILEHYEKGRLFLHYNGTYHSNNKEGIVWYINQKQPELIIKTIATVRQDAIDELDDENIGIADFILVVPSDMATTY